MDRHLAREIAMCDKVSKPVNMACLTISSFYSVID